MKLNREAFSVISVEIGVNDEVVHQQHVYSDGEEQEGDHQRWTFRHNGLVRFGRGLAKLLFGGVRCVLRGLRGD